MIIKNLVNKWNFYDNSNNFSSDLYDELIENLFISKYKLKSITFDLESVRIPSYIGMITLYSNNNYMINNMINMLIEFGSYSGIGIKTSLGMGGIYFEQECVI